MTIKIEDIKVGDKVLVELKVTGFLNEPNGNWIEAEYKEDYILIRQEQIKQHMPKPVDWADVKKGMAFECNGEIVWFALKHPTFDDTVYCFREWSTGLIMGSYHPNRLKRAPEHDKDWK